MIEKQVVSNSLNPITPSERLAKGILVGASNVLLLFLPFVSIRAKLLVALLEQYTTPLS